MYWPALSNEQIKNKIEKALDENTNYRNSRILGLPGTFLDTVVFPEDPSICDGRPFLKTFVNNPNHIGVHTLNKSEKYFIGTQKLEREVIKTCAEQIFQAKKDNFDGYICPGGTEGNIQGIWALRNMFQEQSQATYDQIALIHSEDTHYSVYKASNILNIKNIKVNVKFETREIDYLDLENKLTHAKKNGIKYLIVILNMGTTMFGSVDNINKVEKSLKKLNMDFYFHIDAAFGGLIYPFTTKDNDLNFSHPKVISVTLDAHKMLQAPYGTGVFLTRKNHIQFTVTKEAKYVIGEDYTLCGSRSGANAIAVWMILYSYGSKGGIDFCKNLIEKTSFLTDGLKRKGLKYFQHPGMNIVTIESQYLSKKIAQKYSLVPDSHTAPSWYKIVVMDHVSIELLKEFIDDI